MRLWLIQMRELKGFTQQEAAELSGISRSYYSGIETGSRNASVPAAKGIGDALGFEWTLFFEEKRLKTSQKKKRIS